MIAELPDLSLLMHVLDAAIEVDGAMGGNIQQFDRSTNALRIVAQRGFREPFLAYFEAVTVGDGSACAQALADRRRILVRDTETDTAFAPHRGVAEEAGFRAVISIPAMCSDGTLVGVLSTHFSAPYCPSEKVLGRLGALAQVAARIIEGSRLAASLDGGSGLRMSPGRELPESALREASAARHRVSQLGRRGASAPLVDGAIRHLDRLLPELRRLGRASTNS